MKRFTILLGALSLLLAVSCTEEKEKPKVIYQGEKSSTKVDAGQGDSTDIKVADLPVLIEGTKYLIHPIGNIRV